MLPNIDIQFANGNSGTVVPSPDGVFGLLAHAEAVASTFELDKVYIVKSMKDVSALGIIDSIGNHRLFKWLKEFFTEAGEGTELWMMGIAKTMLVSDFFMPDVSLVNRAEKMLDASNGKLRGIFTLCNPATAPTPPVTDGFIADVMTTTLNAQAFAENYTNVKKAPFFVVTEGFAFNGDIIQLPDLTTFTRNRVAIVLGDSEKRTGASASNGACTGIIAGRLAKNPVHVNIGKVRDGALKLENMYMLDTPVESFDVASLHDKGYITFRAHQGKSGYFVTDDPQATEVADDYRQITHRRVIDKAYRIAYVTLLEDLLSEIPVTNSGTIQPSYAKSMEGRVIGAINAQMTANGELSVDATDPNDFGVICKISLTQNLTSTSKIQLEYLSVRPKGHARYINVPLGFVNVNS